MRGFLADDSCLGKQPGKALRQYLFAFVIGYGHDIVCRLIFDFVRRQRLVARQNGARRGLQHRCMNCAGEGVVQLPPFTNDSPR